MKVKVIKEFIDNNENKHRKLNEIFELTDERLKEINGTIYGSFVEEIKYNKKKKEAF